MREKIQSALVDAVTRLLASRDSAVARVYRSLLDMATRHHAILVEEPLFGMGSALCTVTAAEILGTPQAFIQSQPDYLFLPSDGQTITKESMQETLSRLSMGAVSDRRVVVWEDMTRLNTASANAFLKTLEEPDSRTLFLLTTPSKERLLPTILSRTIPVELTVPDLEAVTTELLNGLDTQQAETFRDMSFGRPYLAAALLVEREEKNQPFTEVLQHCHSIAKQLLSESAEDYLKAYAALISLKETETKKKQSELPFRPLHLFCFIVEGTIEKMLHSTTISPLSKRAKEMAMRIVRFRQDMDHNMSLKLAALDLVFGTTNNTL